MLLANRPESILQLASACFSIANRREQRIGVFLH
jgi:hypothetical protein